jgi:hypothetical protein
VKVGEEEVKFLGFFAGDEKDGTGETVRKTVHAGSGFAFRGRGSGTFLCYVARHITQIMWR